MAKSASKGGSGGPAGGGGSSGTGEKRNSMLPAKRRSARRNPAAKAAPSRPSPSAVQVRPAKMNKSATSVWTKGGVAPPTGAAEKADRRRAAKKKPLASGKSTPGEVIKPNPKTPKTAAGGTNKKKGATSSTAKPKSSHPIMSTSLLMGGQLLGENHPRKMDEDAFQVVDDDCSSDDDLFPKLEPLSSLAKQTKSRETSSLQPKSRETKQHKKGLAFSSSSAACQGACSAAGPVASASKSSGSALWPAKACSGASASGGILSKARSAAGPSASSLSTSGYFFAAGGAGGASSSSSSWKGSTTSEHDQYSYAPKMPSGKTTATSSGAANVKPAALAAQLQAAPSSTMIHPPKNHTKNGKKELRAASYLEAMNLEDEDVDEESCYMDSEDESDEDSDSFDNYPLIRCRECRLIEQGVITEDFEHACFFVRSPTAGDKDVCLPVDVLSLGSCSPSSSSSRGEGWRQRGAKGVVAMEVDE